MSGLVDRHVDFLDALRAAGLQVSLAEGVDAVAALSALRWDDRETLRTAYAATLVKRQSHRPTFDTLFDLYFPPLVGAAREPSRGREPERATTAARRGRCASDLLAALVAGDLEAQQAAGRRRGRPVRRDAGPWPGLSGWSAYTALRRLSPDDLVARIVEALTADGPHRGGGRAARRPPRRLVRGDGRGGGPSADRRGEGPRPRRRGGGAPSLDRLDFTRGQEGRPRGDAPRDLPAGPPAGHPAGPRAARPAPRPARLPADRPGVDVDRRRAADHPPPTAAAAPHRARGALRRERVGGVSSRGSR